MSSSPRHSSRPIFLSLAGLVAIGALLALPGLVGIPDGERMPDMVRFLGRFHPLVLHLPIGMVSFALLLEALRFFDRKRFHSGADSLVLGFAAATSVASVLLGFLLYHGGGWEESELAESHMWNGIYFTCAMIMTFLFKVWSETAPAGRGNGFAALSRLGLVGSSVIMGVASHDGGSLTHGSNHLTEYAPESIRKILNLPNESPVGRDTDAPLVIDEIPVFAQMVMPIMERRCVNCHGADSSKGRLRLDSYEAMLKGGRDGPAVVPGSLAESLMIIRAELPDDDDEHMPPVEKPQLDSEELLVLKWWIENGADPSKTIAEMGPSTEVMGAIAKLNGSTAVTELQSKLPNEVAANEGPGSALIENVAALSEEYPGTLQFEFAGSSNVTFNAASLRENLDDEGFAKFSPLIEHLVTVDLSGTRVTDRSVALLSDAKNLRSIRLSETQITDVAIDALLNLVQLESVNLFGTAVSDAGIQKLDKLTKLKHLYLWQTQTSADGIESLKQRLPECEIVTSE